MIWRQRTFGYACVFTMLAAAMMVAPARAQNVRSVTFYTVKPDRTGDFLAATKEYAGLMKKGGSERSFQVWHSVTGANEYAFVRNYAKWAELDVLPETKMKEHEAAVQSIFSRIGGCEESYSRIIDELLPDLSLPQTGGVQMIRVLRTRVRPDRVSEYMALVKNEVLPAAKKAGLKVYGVSQVRYGAPSSEFISVAGLNNWADLDRGTWIQKTMGEEGYQRFLAKVLPLIIESEVNVYRFVPDSSYSPAR